MTIDSQQIVTQAWNFAHVLRDDGLSYMAYTEQITFLLFLKMADELTKTQRRFRKTNVIFVAMSRLVSMALIEMLRIATRSVTIRRRFR